MVKAPLFNLDQLTGRSRTHLTAVSEPGAFLHTSAVVPFLALKAAAAADGIDLVAVSAFRDFDRQLAIWNAKFRGERPMQNRRGEAIDSRRLTPDERVDAIQWWSALPGASRHHWGTDFDVMDRAAVPAHYRLAMEAREYGPGGPFHRLTTWLDARMHAFGFYRPFATDRGGVQPEPWHLSYAPIAVCAARELTLDGLRTVLASAAIEGKAEVLAALARNFANFVINVDDPPGTALGSPLLK